MVYKYIWTFSLNTIKDPILENQESNDCKLSMTPQMIIVIIYNFEEKNNHKLVDIVTNRW